MTTDTPEAVEDLARRLNDKAAFLNADCDCGTCQQCEDGLLICAAENHIRSTAAELAKVQGERDAAVERINDLCLSAESAAGCDEGATEDVAYTEILSFAGSPLGVSYAEARAFLATLPKGAEHVG